MFLMPAILNINYVMGSLIEQDHILLQGQMQVNKIGQSIQTIFFYTTAYKYRDYTDVYVYSTLGSLLYGIQTPAVQQLLSL